MHSSLHVSPHQVHLFAGWIPELSHSQDEVTTVKPSVKPADEGFKLGKFLCLFSFSFFSLCYFHLRARVFFV
jgi:hypothetical protein